MNQFLVKHSLMQEFRELATSEGCKVLNVVEQISRQLILYILEVPEQKEELINDMAFMTFIKNPKFQKYYNLTSEVQQRIKDDDEFHQWRVSEQQALETEKISDQILVRLILDGIYPFRNKISGRFEYLKNSKGFYFGTRKSEDFKKHWNRKLIYLGEGQLTERQRSELNLIEKFIAIENIKKAA